MADQINLNLDFNLIDEHKDSFLLQEDKLSLAQLIPRIVHERGPFINIKEDDLIKEIEQLKTEDLETTESAENSDEIKSELGDSNDEVPTSQSVFTVNEEFYKNKNEVLKNIQSALNESSLSLDFVSLLISSVRPAAGSISMSAHLKKFVAPGSLSSDKITKVKSRVETEEKFKENKIIGLGWKLSSLENSSNNLRNASARLAEEVFKEKVFWDSIKKNFNTKEILFKTREKQGNKRVLAVKYGYKDSGSNYKIEGNAILKSLPNENSIQFIPMDNKSIMNKTIRIRILSKNSTTDDIDYEIVGESKVNSLTDSTDIKSQIENARYFIFEEELFNQLIEEAHGLIAYNVNVENESKLSFELNNEIIEIEYIELNTSDENNDELIQDTGRSQNTRAELIATYLRLMLTIKHKTNLSLRNQIKIIKPASSFRSKEIVNPYQIILKPLVGQFRHEFLTSKLHTLIKRITSVSSKPITIKILKFSNSTKIQDPFKRISNPPVSKFKIFLGDLKLLITLDFFDFVNFIIHVHVSKNGKILAQHSFEDLRQLEECLEWIIEENDSS
ncbi:hypothetical protein WICMUC_004240 [Wickerhamomyces mucosus]|uniref:Mediator of RNA polymerase II transcription subunit 17 n=1 Tax=Wickerhamomyces mucosus TaxID=1378264 RepID=A0A9P8PJE8_9ASCO|nr:hypothetical protein WICMUC_004240 [Wickerhamomyces mucosus]